jgi:hypothetical protein
MSKIIIEHKKETEQIAISMEGELHFQDAILALNNTILFFANEFLATVPEQHKAEAKAQMYDYMNERASALLELFAPEFELRPSLTEEALMKLENEVLLSKMQE